jgi:signal transduction histidine kinase
MVASILPVARDVAPRGESEMGIWWLGPEEPPAWTTGLRTRVEAVGTPAALPLEAVDVVLLMPSAQWPGGTAQLLHAVRQRCPNAELVVVASDVAPAAEARLLRDGAALVLDDRVDPDLAVARLEQVLNLVRARRALRKAGDTPASDEQYGKRLMALSFASRLLTTLHDEDEVFRRLVDIAARELNSGRVSLMYVNREAGVLEMRYAVGIPEHVMREARPRLGEGIAGTCALLGKPLFIDDHRRVREMGVGDLREFIPDGTDFRNLPMSLTVPIRVKGTVVGVVNVTDRSDDQRYTQQDIAFIQALMGQAGYLLENQGLLRHLQDARAFSEQVINAIEDPLVVLDDDLRLVSCNRRFIKEFGGGAPGDMIWDVLPLPDEARQVVAQAILPDAPPSELLECHLGDRELEISLTPFADGDRPRLLVFMRDVTARRQMERRLMGAEKMASLGVLAAGVAHEINNPVSFIKANARHAVEYVDDLKAVIEAWHEAAEAAGALPEFAEPRRIEQEVDVGMLLDDLRVMMNDSLSGVARVERIVQSLRTFAHPDTERPSQADVPTLLENAITLTVGQWKYKLELVRDFEAVPPIWCLPNQLEQVFINLITNAAQAAAEWGRLTLTIRPADGGVRVLLEDTCGGIPPEILGRIFEPFFTTKDIGKGTGLGLSIAYNTLQNHGGRIEVRSIVGHGTCFALWLPAGDEERPIVAKQLSRYRI